jgi:hypothetical protein
MLTKLLLTVKLIKEHLSFGINIPIFDHSLAQTWHAAPAFHGRRFGNLTATEKLSRQLAPGRAIIPCVRQKPEAQKDPLISIICRSSDRQN